MLSTSWYHGGRNEVIIAALTSNTRRAKLPGEVTIRHWRETGLPWPTVVTMILRTVPATDLGEPVGSLHSEDLESVNEHLRVSLGL